MGSAKEEHIRTGQKMKKEICLYCFVEKTKCRCFEELMINLKYEEYYEIENYINR